MIPRAYQKKLAVYAPGNQSRTPNMLPMNVSEGKKMHPGAELSHHR